MRFLLLALLAALCAAQTVPPAFPYSCANGEEPSRDDASYGCCGVTPHNFNPSCGPDCDYKGMTNNVCQCENCKTPWVYKYKDHCAVPMIGLGDCDGAVRTGGTVNAKSSGDNPPGCYYYTGDWITGWNKGFYFNDLVETTDLRLCDDSHICLCFTDSYHTYTCDNGAAPESTGCCSDNGFCPSSCDGSTCTGNLVNMRCDAQCVCEGCAKPTTTTTSTTTTTTTTSYPSQMPTYSGPQIMTEMHFYSDSSCSNEAADIPEIEYLPIDHCVDWEYEPDDPDEPRSIQITCDGDPNGFTYRTYNETGCRVERPPQKIRVDDCSWSDEDNTGRVYEWKKYVQVVGCSSEKKSDDFEDFFDLEHSLLIGGGCLVLIIMALYCWCRRRKSDDVGSAYSTLQQPN